LPALIADFGPPFFYVLLASITPYGGGVAAHASLLYNKWGGHSFFPNVVGQWAPPVGRVPLLSITSSQAILSWRSRCDFQRLTGFLCDYNWRRFSSVAIRSSPETRFTPLFFPSVL